MFGASPYLYMGKERIEHEHHYNEFYDDAQKNFNYVLDNADKIKNMLVRGVMEQDDTNNLRSINSKVQREATDIHRLWFNMKMGSRFMR
jgi:hypothetical protein